MPLKVPAGQQKGFQIDYNFGIERDTITSIVLDVDLTKLVFAGRSDKAILNTQAVNVIDKNYAGNILGRVLGKFEEDGDIKEEFIDIDNRDVYVEAYNVNDYDSEAKEFKDGAEPEAISLTSIEEISGRDAGSFMLRGLSDGEYKLRAFVGYKEQSEDEDEDEMKDEIVIDDSDYEVKILEEPVSVIVGEKIELDDPIILSSVDLEESEENDTEEDTNGDDSGEDENEDNSEE